MCPTERMTYPPHHHHTHTVTARGLRPRAMGPSWDLHRARCRYASTPHTHNHGATVVFLDQGKILGLAPHAVSQCQVRTMLRPLLPLTPPLSTGRTATPQRDPCRHSERALDLSTVGGGSVIDQGQALCGTYFDQVPPAYYSIIRSSFVFLPARFFMHVSS